MQCPWCWRPIKFDEKYSKVISCNYCNNILEFWGSELIKIWEQWDFIDFPSIFEVWKIVEYKWKKYYIKWQLRYEYDWWFFDKFFTIVDWNEVYIEEDDWQIKFSKDWDFKKSGLSLIDKIAWETFDFDWKLVFIQEVWIFKLINLKWIVNNILIPWKEYEYLDWLYNWKNYFFERDVQNWKVRVNNQV